MPRRLLVVITTEVADGLLRDVVRSRAGDDAEMLVVAPAVKAIEDALRTFAADEILIVAQPDDRAGWLEEGTGATAQARFCLPVTRVTVAEDGLLARPSG